MASGDLIALLPPEAFASETGPISPGGLAGIGVQKAMPLRKAALFSSLFRVPLNGTPLSTGLTVNMLLVDDPNNPGAGLVVDVGITIVPVLTTAGVLTAPALTNEVTGTATINATEGVVTTLSIAVANSKLSSLAAGNWASIQIRRLGTNSADTHPGAVLIPAVSIQDT